VARFDGILDGLHGEVLAELDTAPTLDNRIEACADDIDAWEEDSLHGDDEGHQRFAARRVLVNLQLITLLHQMKAKPT
jgi:hypothetical protein